MEVVSTSAAVTSTLVTGSAATTSRCTGFGELDIASITRWWNNSALAKKSGASQRNSSRPGSASPQDNADVVVAPNLVDSAEHGEVWPPPVPEEFDDGDHDREPDARDHAEHCHADEAAHREPELPVLDAPDATQIGDFEEPDRGRDHDGGERRRGEVPKQAGREDEEQRDRDARPPRRSPVSSRPRPRPRAFATSCC